MSEEVLDIADVMERVQDDKELLLELLDIFEEDYLEKRESLTKYLENKDLLQIKDVAHSMKGAAGNISAKAIFQTCSQMEEMAEGNQFDQIVEMITTLDQQFTDLKNCISEIKKQFSS